MRVGARELASFLDNSLFFARRMRCFRGRRCRAHGLGCHRYRWRRAAFCRRWQGRCRRRHGAWCQARKAASSWTRVDAGQEAAHRRQARRAVLAVAAAHAEAFQRLGTEVVDPFADRLVAAHAAQRRGARERQHRRERVAPPLPAAGVVDVVEECGKGSNLCGAEHHLRHSMSQRGVEMVRAQLGPRGP